MVAMPVNKPSPISGKDTMKHSSLTYQETSPGNGKRDVASRQDPAGIHGWRSIALKHGIKLLRGYNTTLSQLWVMYAFDNTQAGLNTETVATGEMLESATKAGGIASSPRNWIPEREISPARVRRRESNRINEKDEKPSTLTA
jgi:hypothetical protein